MTECFTKLKNAFLHFLLLCYWSFDNNIILVLVALWLLCNKLIHTGGDVTVYVFNINQPSLPALF